MEGLPRAIHLAAPWRKVAVATLGSASGHRSQALADSGSLPSGLRSEVRAEDNVEIRFPWQKLMHLVKSPGENGNGTPGITPAAADALAQKFRSRRPARNVLPAAGAVLGKAGAAAPTPAFREPSAAQVTDTCKLRRRSRTSRAESGVRY